MRQALWFGSIFCVAAIGYRIASDQGEDNEKTASILNLASPNADRWPVKVADLNIQPSVSNKPHEKTKAIQSSPSPLVPSDARSAIKPEEDPRYVEKRVEIISRFESEQIAQILEELPSRMQRINSASNVDERLELQIRILQDLSSIPLDEASRQKARTTTSDVFAAIKSLGSSNEELTGSQKSALSEGTHYANLVRGRIALQNGDLERAEIHLLEASKISGSPTLSSFGPNLTLARELLLRNEKATVLAYIEACTKFWNSEIALKTANHWKAEIDRGKVPDFGANIFH